MAHWHEHPEEVLQKIKIKTMYDLVEDITIEVEGRTMQKKLIFLTSRQAQQFEFSNMVKVLSILDIKVVIPFCFFCF
jgi:hypothetical protein